MPQARRAIASVARFRPDNRVALVLVVAMAALGTAHILVRTSTYGPAITLDSIHYLSTAGNLAAGAGLTIHDGTPLQPLAPFLPMLLAFIDTLGVDPRESVRWVNAAAFGLVILVSGLWLLRTLSSRTLALAATLIILASLPLNDLAAQAMTEPLFVLLSILALTQLGLFLTGEARWKPVLLAAVFTALATLTRYPGIALILAGAPLLLLHRDIALTTRLRYVIAFGGIASLPAAAAIARRWLLADTLGPLEGASGQSLADSLHQVASVAGEWVVPEAAPDWSANLWLAAGALLAAGMAAMLIVRTIHRGAARQHLRAALPFGLFVPLYLVFIVITTPRLVGQAIDSRYLLPLYIPVILTGVFLLDRLIRSGPVRDLALPRWAPVSVILIIVLASTGFAFHKNLVITADARESGYFESTYNTAYWDGVETLEGLSAIKDPTLVFSHDVAAIWWEYPDEWDGYFWLGDDLGSIIRLIENHPQAVYLVSLSENYSHNNSFISFLNNVDVALSTTDGFVLRIPEGWIFDSSKFTENMAVYFSVLTESVEASIRSVFDIYIANDTIIYAKDSCEDHEVNEWFYLHIIPIDVSHLPIHRQDYGFDNLDFLGSRNDIRFGTTCIVSVPLPPYAIATISTGQYSPRTGEQTWSAEFAFPDGSQASGIHASPVQWRFDKEQYRADLARYRNERVDEYGTHVASSTFDVYVNGRTLVYVRESCTPIDTEDWFFLHIDPADPADLPAKRQQFGFDSLNFPYDWHATSRIEGDCLAIVELPDYDIVRIRTGQSDKDTGHHLWIVEFILPDEYGAWVASGEFDVYANWRTLVYVREPCIPTDTEARFFLHIDPSNPADLPTEHQSQGYETRDFSFDGEPTRFERKCLTTVELPDYAVARIRTGQYDETGTRWSVEFSPPEYGAWLGSGEFDVYFNGRALVYVKDPCIPADTEAVFFLHIDPINPADLPARRQQSGFDNLDFLYDNQATSQIEGECLATVELPDYDIAHIHTGQYDETGRIWGVDFSLPRDP